MFRQASVSFPICSKVLQLANSYLFLFLQIEHSHEGAAIYADCHADSVSSPCLGETHHGLLGHCFCTQTHVPFLFD